MSQLQQTRTRQCNDQQFSEPLCENDEIYENGELRMPDPCDEYCREVCERYPDLNHCGATCELEESDPAYLIKVEGGNEYLVEMEPRVENQVTLQSQSLLDE